MKIETREKEEIKKFERVFRDSWKIAKEKGIEKEDIAEEIKAIRNEKN